MRRFLESVSLAALVLLLSITAYALYGPDPLPASIPTHFGLDGRPNGWGPPAALYLLPGVAAGLYFLMTLVGQFPSAFNYPVRVTAQNRARLQALALNMISWLKVELLCLFLGIQISTIHAARHALAGIGLALVPVSILAVFTTIGVHLVAMFRAPRTG